LWRIPSIWTSRYIYIDLLDISYMPPLHHHPSSLNHNFPCWYAPFFQTPPWLCHIGKLSQLWSSPTLSWICWTGRIFEKETIIIVDCPHQALTMGKKKHLQQIQAIALYADIMCIYITYTHTYRHVPWLEVFNRPVFWYMKLRPPEVAKFRHLDHVLLNSILTGCDLKVKRSVVWIRACQIRNKEQLLQRVSRLEICLSVRRMTSFGHLAEIVTTQNLGSKVAPLPPHPQQVPNLFQVVRRLFPWLFLCLFVTHAYSPCCQNK